MNIAYICVIFILIPTGLIFLQIYFSKSNNKWAGLIIPILFFCISLLIVSNIAVFNTSSTTMQEFDENGRLVHNTVVTTPLETTKSLPNLAGTIVVLFTLYNMPTALFLAIYFVCKGKKKRNPAIEKMRIQDLE